VKKSCRAWLRAVSFLLFVSGPVGAQQDVAGSKDHPLFTRMPGFYISSYEEQEFGGYVFRDAKFNEVRVEGRLVRITYEQKEGAPAVSPLQIHRNYENAIRKIGGTVLFSNDEYSYMRLSRDGKEIWVEVTAYGPKPDLVIVEKQEMVQDVVANAEALAAGIRATGHIAVYGILFDTGSAVIKPESKPALDEVAKLLKQDASLQLNVVGHTDSVGTVAVNMKLSQSRAESVVKALVGQYGIAAARLRAFGNGPYAPVATNRTEEGRAKNRRVELVEQ